MSLVHRLSGWGPDRNTASDKKIAVHQFWAMMTQHVYGLSTRAQIIAQFQINDPGEQATLDQWISHINEVATVNKDHVVLMMHYEHTFEVAELIDAQDDQGNFIPNTARYKTTADIEAGLNQARQLVKAGLRG